jgi:hypothetical protein
MIIQCNANKLHSEFVNAGIKPFPVFDNEDGSGDFTFPEGTDMTLVQQVIDAHDPTPLPPQPTETEQLRADVDYISIMTGVDL